MFEFLEGVAVQRTVGKLPIEAQYVLRGKMRVKTSDPEQTFSLTVNGSVINFTPKDLPPGFELKSLAPPYIVEFEVYGKDVKLDSPEEAEGEFYGYVIVSPDQFRFGIEHYLGNDDVLKALGVIATTLQNLKPEPVKIELERW